MNMKAVKQRVIEKTRESIDLIKRKQLLAAAAGNHKEVLTLQAELERERNRLADYTE